MYRYLDEVSIWVLLYLGLPVVIICKVYLGVMISWSSYQVQGLSWCKDIFV